MQLRVLFGASALLVSLPPCRETAVSGDDPIAAGRATAPAPHSDTEFPAAPIIERLHSGEISPEEAARQIMTLREEDSPPVRMPPESYFASLPEDQRANEREMARLLVSWTQDQQAAPDTLGPRLLPKTGEW